MQQSDPSHYRTVRHLTLFGQVLVALINAELDKHIIQKTNNKQYGFLSSRSIADALRTVNEFVYHFFRYERRN